MAASDVNPNDDCILGDSRIRFAFCVSTTVGVSASPGKIGVSGLHNATINIKFILQARKTLGRTNQLNIYVRQPYLIASRAAVRSATLSPRPPE